MGDAGPSEGSLLGEPRECDGRRRGPGDGMTAQRVLNKYRSVRKSLGACGRAGLGNHPEVGFRPCGWKGRESDGDGDVAPALRGPSWIVRCNLKILDVGCCFVAVARRADLLAPTDKLHDVFVAVDTLQAEACRALNGGFDGRHMSIDSQVFNALTEIGEEKSAKLTNKSGSAAPEDLIRLLRQNYMTSESSPFQWSHFGYDHGKAWHIASIGLRAPQAFILDDPRLATTRAEGAGRKPRRLETKELKKPKETAEDEESEDAFLLSQMKYMHKRLARAGSMHFRELVLDVDSYAKTVENIFVFSNLLNTKGLEMDAKGAADASLGMNIRPLFKKDPSYEATSKTIFSLSPREWQEMREVSLLSTAGQAPVASTSTIGGPGVCSSLRTQTPRKQPASVATIPEQETVASDYGIGPVASGSPTCLQTPAQRDASPPPRRSRSPKEGSGSMNGRPAGLSGCEDCRVPGKRGDKGCDAASRSEAGRRREAPAAGTSESTSRSITKYFPRISEEDAGRQLERMSQRTNASGFCNGTSTDQRCKRHKKDHSSRRLRKSEQQNLDVVDLVDGIIDMPNDAIDLSNGTANPSDDVVDLSAE
ncbi:unnamed protein product [Ostreobium quekettii]|uniref:Non-structural maintenance of chromosomes element 4 n=1 Tax=Ostreobium quekettii TaxID=121088 RepID=A0A8S1J2A0_9CHLO|nr:unnamed protein product [Ostreobium quekettii]|eukprot:evm.model.scf_2824.2 EVM.evm.TU.scf_2824.2   scf_2824:6366-10760(-)